MSRGLAEKNDPDCVMLTVKQGGGIILSLGGGGRGIITCEDLMRF